MSVISIIRDYVEVLNNLTDSFSGVVPFTEILKETSLYIFKTLQYIFIYIISFQWIRDFTLLPITIPQLSSSLIKEKFVLENSSNLFLNFLEIPKFQQNSFLLGFFNSLFLTFPVSVIHILSIRRLYIKGIPSAVYSISGYLIGQIFFILCVIFGIRTILTPWLTLEPLNYILGLILIFRIIYSMTQENLRQFDNWDEPQYKQFFLTNFLIAWCEQSSIFQYLGNLNFSPTSSLLETGSFSTFFDHTLYIFGLIIGCGLFTLFWGFICIQIKKIFILYTPLFLTKFIRTINTGSIILAIGLSLSSIPFYGLDYILTNPFGFISQDKVFKNTVFDQYNTKDSIMGLGTGSSQFTSVEFDVSPFDRGRYGIFPEIFDFEDLNYRGEAEWTSRNEKAITMAHSRAEVLRSKFIKIKKSDEKQKQLEKAILPIISKFETSSDTDTTLTNDVRFQDWYSGDSTITQEDTDGTNLSNLFVEVQDTSFPMDFIRMTSTDFDAKDNMDLRIKQKYYSNSVYQNLLSAEIDLLLMRQPKEFRLTGEQELDLYTKRRMIQSYYDSLRDYSKLPYIEEFDDFFDGTKTFSNKIYNQQFKGTLRSVSRLFSLTVDPDSSTKSNELVLKYDQPLYTFSKTDQFSAYHEELDKANPSVFQTLAEQSSQRDLFDTMISGPLYAGWDEKLRKFVLTNKFLPRNLAGYKFKLKPQFQNKFIKQKTFDKNQTIKFTVWPLKENILNQGKTNSSVPFSILYTPKSEFVDDPTFQNFSLSTLPANWETRNRKNQSGKTYENLFDYLAPQRGGFIWPGNQKLNLNFIKSEKS